MDIFLTAFDDVPDRRADNARHDLGELLVIAFVAVLCGATTCAGMAMFDRAKAFLQQVGLRRDCPLPLQEQATRTISAVARALKRFMRATRMWISVFWRSGVSHWSAIGPSDNGEGRRCARRMP